MEVCTTYQKVQARYPQGVSTKLMPLEAHTPPALWVYVYTGVLCVCLQPPVLPCIVKLCLRFLGAAVYLIFLLVQ